MSDIKEKAEEFIKKEEPEIHYLTAEEALVRFAEYYQKYLNEQKGEDYKEFKCPCGRGIVIQNGEIIVEDYLPQKEEEVIEEIKELPSEEYHTMEDSQKTALFWIKINQLIRSNNHRVKK